MKVSKLIHEPYIGETSAWSGQFDEVINKLGFSIINSMSGNRDNRTDGEFHMIFTVAYQDKIYKMDVNSNWYYNEREKIRAVMNSELFEWVDE
jgi:hypothetical protein